MFKSTLTAISILAASTVSVQAADVEGIIGGLVGLAIVNEILNSDQQHHHYHYDRPHVPRRGSHPNQVCSVHTEYSGQWIRKVESNCYGEVLRVTRHRRW